MGRGCEESLGYGNENTERRLKFGAINVATLRGIEEEMVELMKLRQLSVLGLSETRGKDAVIELYMEDTGSFTAGKTWGSFFGLIRYSSVCRE